MSLVKITAEHSHTVTPSPDDAYRVLNQGPDGCFYGGPTVNAVFNQGILLPGQELPVEDDSVTFLSARRSRLVVTAVSLAERRMQELEAQVASLSKRAKRKPAAKPAKRGGA